MITRRVELRLQDSKSYVLTTGRCDQTCLLWESNPGPSLYKRDALPTVPKRQYAIAGCYTIAAKVVLAGIEPATFACHMYNYCYKHDALTN